MNKSRAPLNVTEVASSLPPDHSPPIQELAKPGCWHRWAVEFASQNDLARAAQFFRHAIVLDPLDPLLRFDFGVALAKAERYTDAISAFSEASRLDPIWSEPIEIQRELNGCLEDHGSLADAGDLLLPMSADESRRFSNLFSPQTDFDTDVSACIDLVAAIDRLYPPHEANPQFIELADRHLKNSALLVAASRRLIGLSGSVHDRASEWMTISDGFAAKRLSLLAVRSTPQFQSLMTAALVLQVLGRHAHALVLIDRAVHERPYDTAALTTRAELLLEVGDTQAGLQQLSLLSHRGTAGARHRWMRATARSTDVDLDREIQELQSLLTANSARAGGAAAAPPQASPVTASPVTASPERRERWQLLYALGWRYEQTAQIDDAFATYAVVSAERKSHFLAKHSVPEDPGLRTAQTIKHYDRQFFESRQGWGVASRRPLFIVGLPRSGTTLVEQILGRHPQVATAGELNDMSIYGRIIGRFHKDGASGVCHDAPHPPALTDLSAARVRELARLHLASLSSLDRHATYVADKMPTNFQLLGMIALMFPGARIIHCVRDVIDTCVSCYRNNLSWPFFDLDAMASYAIAYQSVMDHWKRSLPQQILDVSYERVVEDLEGQSRRMLNFLDLPWDPACLTFYESQRSVRTPSRMQVRRPIYRSSVGAWQSCQRHIKPLLERLTAAQSDTCSIEPHAALFVRSPRTSLA
ncbi:MAG: sulfotransferase [Planctomycetaceae bacterium]